LLKLLLQKNPTNYFVHWENKCYTYLIICGTVTLEFSSNTMVIKPLHLILSMHCENKHWKLLKSKHRVRGLISTLFILL